jgi:acid phosphatase family membrane protein YuiD
LQCVPDKAMLCMIICLQDVPRRLVQLNKVRVTGIKQLPQSHTFSMSTGLNPSAHSTVSCLVVSIHKKEKAV